MNKKIQIYGYVFNLKKAEDSDTIISCSFKVKYKAPDEMTEEELKIGHTLQRDIFKGAYDWLIFNRGLIRISEFGIEICLSDPVYTGSISWKGGHITSEMKEVCPHCEDRECEFDCPESLEWASDRDPDFCRENNEELASNRHFNYGVDAIEIMVLTHAMQGLNVESELYKAGIRAALEGLANHT